MSRDELLKALGLNDKLPDLPEGDLTPGGTDAPLSPTALQLDDWNMRMGQELSEQWALENGKHEGKGAEAADCFAAAFEPDPKLAEACIDKTRHEFISTLLSTQEYKGMHEHTQWNELASEIAALGYMDQLDKLRGETPAKDGIERDMQVVRHVAKACEQVKEDVETMRDAATACGLGEGQPGSNDAKRIAELYKQVRNNRTVRRICELAGRFRRFAQSKQRQKTMHGYDDVVGVVTDAALGRLLPHELAKVDDEGLGLDFLRRFVERQTMCPEHSASEPVAKGPVIVIVDESGSMAGDKGETAKAIALAMAWIARQQRRWCALVAFSGGTEGRRLELPPGKWDEAALCNWLESWLGGGTELDVPLVQVPLWYPNTDGKTDLLCITDAIVHAPPELVAKFNAWKARTKCRMITVVVGSTEAGDLEKVSDETHYTHELGIDCRGIQNALSI